jgi:hypothetical protein
MLAPSEPLASALALLQRPRQHSAPPGPLAPAHARAVAARRSAHARRPSAPPSRRRQSCRPAPALAAAALRQPPRPLAPTRPLRPSRVEEKKGVAGVEIRV